MSEQKNRNEKTTIEDLRSHYSHKRAVSGHKAAFAGAVLCGLGYLSAINVEDAKVSVDRSSVTAEGGYVIRSGGMVKEHGLASVSLIGFSILGFAGAFGCAVRAGDRYVRSAQHRNGSKDHQYDPRSYDV